MTTRLDPLEYLEREDKWFLGGGRAAMFAPAFPRHLTAFGFWDESYFADVRLERLFTILVLDENGQPVRLSQEKRRWTPDALTQTHTSTDGLRIREDKVVTPHDVLASRIAIYNEGKRAQSLHLILWSLQDQMQLGPGVAGTSAEDTTRLGDFISFARTVSYGENPYSDQPAANAGWGERAASNRLAPVLHRLHVALGSDRSPASHAIAYSEQGDTSPLWQVSIVPEWFHDGFLVSRSSSSSSSSAAKPPSTSTTTSTTTRRNGDGHLHLCLHYPLDIPSGESRSIQFGAALNLDRERSLFYVLNDLQRDVVAMSRESWRKYFEGVPYFECSDPWLQKYYWYRWYGLRLLTVDLSTDADQPPLTSHKSLTHPCVFEGIGGFRSHISYSAQCHMREASWMHDPRLAMGCLEGMLTAQENSGFIPGHLYLWREDRGFYHADWGAAALQVYRVTGDRSFIERIYPGLSRYAEYFERDRDREDSHLYDIVDQGETGQEYMSRYLFVDEHADDWRRIQLKGVDATVYVYSLQRALAEMARILDRHPEAEVWERKASATCTAVREKMWDPERGFFFDVDPETWKRSPFKAAAGFYPFLTNIASSEHLRALSEHLLNSEEFWTPFPTPASPLNDPYFSAEGEWRGRRMSCPWNGRVWPMTNSHVCEALARAAQTLSEDLKPRAAELIHQFVKMLFWNGDPERPNCFEHYNPFTGTPSAYRGIDDYQHSWVVDLIVKYLVGLQPSSSNDLILDPLPFAVDRFSIRDVHYRGHKIDVSWDQQGGYVVSIDGKEMSHSPIISPVRIEGAL